MHMHMSYADIKKLPVRYRKWFVERLIKHFRQMNEQKKPANDRKPLDKLAMFEDQIKKKLS